jgi:hypothetical protein
MLFYAVCFFLGKKMNEIVILDETDFHFKEYVVKKISTATMNAKELERSLR